MVLHYIKNAIQRGCEKCGIRLLKVSNTKPRMLCLLKHEHIQNIELLVDRQELLKRLPKNAKVAELGVDYGEFSAQIIRINKPKKLYLIDLWGSQRYNTDKMNRVHKRFEQAIKKKSVIIKRGFSHEVLKKCEDAYFDWVYIDTSHGYKQTCQELELSRKKVKSGGIIAGHDYCQGNALKGIQYGVIQAVHEFCVKYSWEIIYLTQETHGYWSFALKEIQKKRKKKTVVATKKKK